MTRTVLLLAVGVAMALALCPVPPVSADLLDFLPSYNIYDYWPVVPPMIPTSLIGMPTTTIWDDYLAILAQYGYAPWYGCCHDWDWWLPYLSSQAAFDIMNSIALERAKARDYWAERWDREVIRGERPLYIVPW